MPQSLADIFGGTQTSSAQPDVSQQTTTPSTSGLADIFGGTQTSSASSPSTSVLPSTPTPSTPPLPPSTTPAPNPYAPAVAAKNSTNGFLNWLGGVPNAIGAGATNLVKAAAGATVSPIAQGIESAGVTGTKQIQALISALSDLPAAVNQGGLQNWDKPLNLPNSIQSINQQVAAPVTLPYQGNTNFNLNAVDNQGHQDFLKTLVNEGATGAKALMGYMNIANPTLGVGSNALRGGITAAANELLQPSTFANDNTGNPFNTLASGTVNTLKAAVPAALTSGVTAGVLNKILPGADSTASQILQNSGNSLYEMAIPPSTSEAGMAQAAEAQGGQLERSTAQSAQANGVTGATQKAVGLSAAKAANTLWTTQIQPLLDNSPATISFNDAIAPIEKMISEVAEPGRQSELQAGLDALKADYTDPKFQNMSLNQAQQIKSGLDEFTPQKIFKGQDVSNGYTQVKAEFANSLRQNIYDALPDDAMRTKYLDYANLKNLSKIGIGARTQASSFGGAGNWIGTATRKAELPIVTGIGKLLLSGGKALENSPVLNSILSTILPSLKQAATLTATPQGVGGLLQPQQNNPNPGQ